MRLIEYFSMAIIDCFLTCKCFVGVFLIPLFAIIFWFIPYHEYSFLVVENQWEWSFLFPNIRKVLLLPFDDPQKVSGMLVVADAFFVIWLAVIFIAFTPRRIKTNTRASKVAHITLKDFILSIIGLPLFFATGLIIMFSYDGNGYATSQHHTFEPGFSFALSLGLGWWLVTMTYLIFIKTICGRVKIK